MRYFPAFSLTIFILFSVSSASAETMWPLVENESVVGLNKIYMSKYENDLFDIARFFETGITELKIANPGVDHWLPGEGTPIKVPMQFVLPSASRLGLVINVPEMRIYYYPKTEPVVYTWPISIGRTGWETPLGETVIEKKTTGPTWYPPQSIRDEARRNGRVLPRAIGPGPGNPLGSHALYLGFPTYLIHGTNKPFSIGMRVSHGCVRMYPEHIVEVFRKVSVETPVNIVNQPVKAGWKGNQLYIEVHPIPGNIMDKGEQPGMDEVIDVLRSLVEKTLEDEQSFAVDWKRIEKVLEIANGIPVMVGIKQ